MIRIVVLYDMSNDRCRTKVADICLDYGLDRDQYSVFVGQLKARQIRALSKELRQQAKDDAYILILPISADDWDKRIELGSPIHEL